jgi:plasmid stabilization system protein ParE
MPLQRISTALHYIAQDNLQRAITFVDELQTRTVDTLSTLPNGGRVYKHDTRYIALSGSVVLYEVDGDKKVVRVLHIVNSRTDWKK